MKKSIIVRGPALSRSGYGEQCRFALRALRSREDVLDIHIVNTNWGQTSWISADDEEREWIDSILIKTNMLLQQTQGNPSFDVSLQVTIPNEWEKMAPINIGYTAGIETTKIAPQWVEKSMLMDHIITISNHSKNTYNSTSYQVTNNQTGETIPNFSNKVPITVVNYPVRNFENVELDLDFDTDFNFLAVAQWGPRKNMENLLHWFLQEFSDKEVGMVLKTFGANSATPDEQYMLETLSRQLKRYPDRKCKVYLIHGEMSGAELNSLYNHPKIKCLATLTHGEGFGLPIFEAAYNGLPVIAPGWSGQCDYLYMPEKSKKGKRTKMKAKFTSVSYKLGPVPQNAVWDGVIQADSQWCYPEQQSYKNALNDVYKNIKAKEKQAKQLQKWILENFTEEGKCKEFVDCILKYVPINKEEIDWNHQISQMQVL
tara:strand:- start:1144 stop:2427 length:1284 start_codon:yes stop_codon:yes gene_type:complete